MRLSLRLKFILVISVILLVIFALIAFFLVRGARTSLNSNVNQESLAFASLSVKPIGDAYGLYKDSGTLRILQEMQKFTDLNPNISNVAIVDVTGKPLFSQHPNQAPSIPAGQASNFDAVYATNPSGEIIRITQPYFDDTGLHPFAIVYTVSAAEIQQAIQRQELDILIFAILGLLLSALAAYELVNAFFLGPIQRVSQMSGVIAAGYYSQQIVLERHDEIGQLAGSVNRMAQSLKANIAELQEVDKLKNEFIMITSHNLRTPLTIIEGGASVLKESSLPSQLAEMVEDIEHSARSLQFFAEQMLTIASIEAGQAMGVFETIKLGAVLGPLQKDFRALAKDKKVKLNIDMSHAGTELHGNAQQLAGALRNILDNALKFTPEKGSVTLTSSIENNKLKLAVNDTGTGIKAEELPKLFTKFHRGTSTLKYDYQGTGIGLYAAKLIVEQHRGSITADSKEGEGTTITILLPLNAKPQEPGTPAPEDS